MEQPVRPRPPESEASPRPIPWERGASMVICFGACLLLLWLGFRYAWGILLPFLVAFLLSRLIRPIAEELHRITGISRRLWVAVLVILLTGGALLAAFLGLRRGWEELTRLVASLAEHPEGLLSVLDGALDKATSLSSHLPFLSHLKDSPQYGALCARVDGWAAEAMTHLTEQMAAMLPTAAKTLAEWVPSAFIFITVTLLAGYYFSADDGTLRRSLQSTVAHFTPPALQDRIPALGRRLGRLGRQYLRTFLLLGFLTFLQAFIGLAILKIPYAFLLACGIAVVDVLPLLGTGVILIPWAVISLLTGHLPRAIGLLVLYAVTTTVRQVLEPKLIGDGLGLHPLLSLIAMYAGLRLFGVWGMILAPLVAAGVKSVMGEE